MGDFISVQICDDQALVRAGLRLLLDEEPDLEVMGEAASADEAVAQMCARQPDVLVLDVAVPSRNGLDALLEIAKAAPETRVLVLSQHDDPAYIRCSVRASPPPPQTRSPTANTKCCT